MSTEIHISDLFPVGARLGRIAIAAAAVVVGLSIASSPSQGQLPPEPGDGPGIHRDEQMPSVAHDEVRQRAPITEDDSATTDEGMVVDIAVLANDRDPDGDALRVVGVSRAANGWVLVNGDHTLRYHPDTGFAGRDGFVYWVDDGHGGAGGAGTAFVTVHVNDVADAPVAESQVVETDEDTALAIALVASDADRDRLAFAIERPPAHGSLVGEPPELSYVPDADYNGPDRFVFAVDDGRGGSDTGTVSITIDAVDDAPEAVDDEAVTSEGMVVDIAVLANDRDPDGGVLRVVGVTQAVNGWVLINGDHTLRYQPNTGFRGLDGFAYTVAGTDGGISTATVGVEVKDIADAPVAENQVVETDEDTAVAITLVASDADGDRLAFTIERPPAHGSLIKTAPDLSYVPDADYSGPDRFVFAVDDGRGGSDTGTVSITIDAVDDAPEAVDDEALTSEGMVVDIAVLANDRDPDGGVLRVVGVTQAVSGWVLINGDHTLRYQPNTGFSGLDGFAYTVVDADGGTDTAAVSVTVERAVGP
jgi:N-acetylmuramoyl-L-alanine amidase